MMAVALAQFGHFGLVLDVIPAAPEERRFSEAEVDVSTFPLKMSKERNMEENDTARLQKGVAVLDNLHNAKGALSSSLSRYMRSDVLQNHEIFRGRNPEFVSRVIDDVDVCFFKPGDTILQEGDKATTCYILNQGEVSVQVDGQEVAQLKDGSYFGEICLLGLSERRTASVIAITFCDVRVVHPDKFQFALKRFPVDRTHFQQEAKRRMEQLARRDGKLTSKTQSARRNSRCYDPKSAALKLQPQDFECNGVVPCRRGSLGDIQSLPFTLPAARRRSIPSIVGSVLQNVAEKSLSGDHVRSSREVLPLAAQTSQVGQPATRQSDPETASEAPSTDELMSNPESDDGFGMIEEPGTLARSGRPSFEVIAERDATNFAIEDAINDAIEDKLVPDEFSLSECSNLNKRSKDIGPSKDDSSSSTAVASQPSNAVNPPRRGSLSKDASQSRRGSFTTPTESWQSRLRDQETSQSRRGSWSEVFPEDGVTASREIAMSVLQVLGPMGQPAEGAPHSSPSLGQHKSRNKEVPQDNAVVKRASSKEVPQDNAVVKRPSSKEVPQDAVVKLPSINQLHCQEVRHHQEERLHQLEEDYSPTLPRARRRSTGSVAASMVTQSAPDLPVAPTPRRRSSIHSSMASKDSSKSVQDSSKAVQDPRIVKWITLLD
jgi:hypothetical protein